MQIKSAKAKGRIFQNWVRDQLLLWREFYVDDIRTAIMGETGVDIKINKEKHHLFPYKIEIKSQKKGFSAVYNAYEQSENHKGQGEPLLFIKQNRKKPLVIVDAEYFIRRLYVK